MVREQQVFLAMREQQVCGPAAGTQPPPHLPRILQNRIPNLSPRDEKAAKVSVKLTRKRKRASILLRQLEAPFNSQHNSLPLRGPAALISAVLKPKKSSSKYAH
jgi:hypothetical protein